jgi:hypothetical protein
LLVDPHTFAPTSPRRLLARAASLASLKKIQLRAHLLEALQALLSSEQCSSKDTPQRRLRAARAANGFPTPTRTEAPADFSA